MPRPRKRRRITYRIESFHFKPAGQPAGSSPPVRLGTDELEALRLCDLKGLSQRQAALEMNISRSTLQRMLSRARRQVALALVETRPLILEQA